MSASRYTAYFCCLIQLSACLAQGSFFFWTIPRIEKSKSWVELLKSIRSYCCGEKAGMSLLAPQKHKLLLELFLLLLLQRVSSLADGGFIWMKKLSMLCQRALFHRTYIYAPEKPVPNRLLVCMVTLILFVISNEDCQLIFCPKKNAEL